LTLSPGDRRILTFNTRLPLGEGVYSIEVTAGRPVANGAPMEILDGVQDALTFRMTGAPGYHQVWTSVYIPHTLQIQDPGASTLSVMHSLHQPEANPINE
jgi:hypothetical protein